MDLRSALFIGLVISAVVFGITYVTLLIHSLSSSPELVIEEDLWIKTCRYVVIPVSLRSWQTVSVEWYADDRYVYVGIATKSDLADWKNSVFCLTATMSFPTDFEVSGRGFTGTLQFTAPYTGTYYIVIFHSWHMGQTTIHVHVKITMS